MYRAFEGAILDYNRVNSVNRGFVMRQKNLFGIISILTLCTVMAIPCFAQLIGDSQSCVVTQKAGSNLLIVSCPDGSRTVDAGGRSDLYRIGDRVDIYGLPGNRPSSLTDQIQGSGR